jgi:hypothetical protein
MRRSGIDDFALPLTLAAAIVFVVAMVPALGNTAQSTAASAVPDYVMTITANRLPAACKGLSSLVAAPQCARLLAGEATVRMRETAPRLATR